MRKYYRPIVQTDRIRPANALSLVDGPLWFTDLEEITRDGARVVGVSDVPDDIRKHLTSKRAPLCGVVLQTPSIMGVLNVTPDSFSDGGNSYKFTDAVKRAREMVENGADMVDVGGESTRPGADFIQIHEEIRRTQPVIAALRQDGLDAAISIDTRKGRVADESGADLFNDVTALTFGPDSLQVAADRNMSVCIMHAVGDPKTMQENPVYDDVLLDVYDFLEERIAACINAGIPKEKIMIDVGIGFGKSEAHNLRLLQNISIFHGLGCPILLGVSRKRLIGRIGRAPDTADRLAGSLTLAVLALNQGVQMLRVHDIAETKQAIRLWSAMIGQPDDT